MDSCVLFSWNGTTIDFTAAFSVFHLLCAAYGRLKLDIGILNIPAFSIFQSRTAPKVIIVKEHVSISAVMHHSRIGSIDAAKVEIQVVIHLNRLKEHAVMSDEQIVTKQYYVSRGSFFFWTSFSGQRVDLSVLAEVPPPIGKVDCR